MLSQDQGWKYVIQLMNGISHIKRIYSIRTINYPRYLIVNMHTTSFFTFLRGVKNTSLYCWCSDMDIVIFVAILVDLPFFIVRNVIGFSIVLHLTIYEHCVNGRNIQYIPYISLETSFLFRFSIIPKLFCNFVISRHTRWDCYMNHNASI